MNVPLFGVAVLLAATASLQDGAVPVENEPVHKTVFKNEYVQVFRVMVEPGTALVVHAAWQGTAREQGPAQSPTAKSNEAEAELTRIVLERKVAAERGDIEAWERHVAKDCVWIGASPTVRTNASPKSDIPGEKGTYFTKQLGLQVHVVDATATVTYLEEVHSEHNGKDVVVRSMYLDTFVRQQGSWQLIASSETPLWPAPVDPKAISVAPGILDRYAGRYLFNPTRILSVSRDGNRLLARETDNEKGSELVAENETTFFERGQSWRFIFVRDKSGRVTHLVFRDHGLDTEMPRLVVTSR